MQLNERKRHSPERASEIKDTRVLIVDDSATTRNMVTHSLKSAGYTVDSVSNGDFALNAFRKVTFDYVVTDLDMPGLDGFGLIRAISDMGLRPGIVLVTARGERNLRAARELALSYSVNLLGSFEKPVAEDELLASLEVVARPRKRSGGGSDTVLSEGEFMRGLMTDGLIPVFQPRMRTSDKTLVSAECFARWRAPGGSLLGASAIIRLAREKGYLDILAYRMLEVAMAAQARWLKRGLTLPISVNISGENLKKDDFGDVVSGLADQSGVAPQWIKLEINESELGPSDRVGHEILSRLNMRGFGLSLDDFGTGYASLLHLERIPFSELVIARSFVNRATKNKTARAVLEAAIGLAQKLDLSCTCEGVETEDHLNLVKELGATQAQGYLLGYPMEEDRFMEWMHPA